MGKSCKGCGTCCDPVYLMHKHYEKYKMSSSEWETYKEKWKDHPYLKDVEWINQLIMIKKGTFECPLFDKKKKLCGDYKDRPPVCRDYLCKEIKDESASILQTPA